MRRRRTGRSGLLAALVLIVLTVWTAARVYEWAGSNAREPKAVLYLLQVSAFQQQMLAGELQEAGGLQETGQLEALKRAVYSAQYSHERLLRAADDAAAPPAMGMYRELISCLTGLELSGRRPLTEAEKAMLTGAAEPVKALAGAYAAMLGEDREWNRKETEDLKRRDAELVEYLERSAFKLESAS